ncbi:MAG: hypothetical protein DMF04_08005 [Verrucomicrobia bacterium]|nr:MAG: hypothetical protein DMF04_08005 [Verrucomicrobiota bacterium]
MLRYFGTAALASKFLIRARALACSLRRLGRNAVAGKIAVARRHRSEPNWRLHATHVGSLEKIATYLLTVELC